MELGTIEYLLTISGTIVFTVGSLTWWLSSQFRITRDLVYTRVQEVLNKLEYHEKHDDQRFQDVRNDIWAIRLRNASIDGKILKKHNVLETVEQN